MAGELRDNDQRELQKAKARFREPSPNDTYTQLLRSIQRDPYADDVWSRTVELAQAEEGSGRGTQSFYSHVPLNELIAVGQRLRSTRVRDEQYEILTERCSTDENWYDIVLGHVNKKGFAPITKALGKYTEGGRNKLDRGLDVGTGTGNTIRVVAPFFRQVTGVDKLESVLHKMKDQGQLTQNADIVVGDATSLPVGEGLFDVAVSYGLSHYLSREEMQKYVGELARALKPQGLYFESWVTKEKEDDLLPMIEKEYLTSAKALLTCLIDNLVSRPDEMQSQWSLREMVDTFQQQGFAYETSETNDEGVWFVVFYRKI